MGGTVQKVGGPEGKKLLTGEGRVVARRKEKVPET